MHPDQGAVVTLPDAPPPAGTAEPPARPPALVWALVALHVAVMLMCSLLYPATYGYDEPQHVDMAYAYSQELHLYAPGERRVAAGVARTQRGPSYPPRRSFSDVVPLPRDRRPSLEEQGGGRQLRGGLPNQMVQHPPLYYLLGAAVLRLPGVGGLPFDQQLWLLRLLSVLLLAPLPLLAWAAARALLGPGPPALAAAVLPVTVPGLSRIGGSFTNDTLLTLLGAVLVWLLARVMAGDLRLRTGGWVGATLLAALLTKGFALVLPPVVLAAYAVAYLRHRPGLRRAAGPGLLALGVGGLGLLWWLRNLLLFGAVQPNGWGEEVWRRIIGPPRPGGTPEQFAVGFTRLIAQRVYGGIGLPERPLLAVGLCYAWVVALVLLVAVGLVAGAGGRWGRSALVVLSLPVVLTGAILAYQSWGLFQSHGSRLIAVHARYLYIGLTGAGVAVAAGLVRAVPGRAARWVPGVLLALGVATQVWAWRTLAQAWWVPDAARGDLGAAASGAVDGISAWSPFPPVVTFAPFVGSAVLAVVALVVALRRA
jgi:small subunit ribosomal protein S36